MPTICFASRNPKKAIEMADLMQPHGITVRSVSEFANAPEVDETGTTFAANADLKATVVAQALGIWTLADDSGLMVDSLQGAPGVHSARYAGPAATAVDNKAKLLRELAGVPAEQRTAQFVCQLAVADPNGLVRVAVTGHCRGMILQADQGSGGFGYDPLFLVPEFGKTFAELSLAVKSQVSHRADAFRQLLPKLLGLLSD